MCEHASHYGSQLSQHYDAHMKVLSVWFNTGTQNMSMRIISASVIHDRRGHAALELVVWFEAERSFWFGSEPKGAFGLVRSRKELLVWFEAEIWFEAESRCKCLDLFLCNASPVSNLNLSCSVRGRSVQARLETQKYMMNGNQRESVVSCIVKSSAFSLSDDVETCG